MILPERLVGERLPLVRLLGRDDDPLPKRLPRPDGSKRCAPGTARARLCASGSVSLKTIPVARARTRTSRIASRMASRRASTPAPPRARHRSRRRCRRSASVACGRPRPSLNDMTYVELHCHSSYSFLDGASLPEELAARAAELGYPALALTDHDGVYGSLEFAHAAKALGVRPITGAEVTLTGWQPHHAARRVGTGLCEPVPHPHRGARGHPPRGP